MPGKWSPQFMARYKPTWVYWHLGADGQVLYVGCTSNLLQRDRNHRHRSSWYGRVVAIRRSEPMPWREARAMERREITALQPHHNVVFRRADVEDLRDQLAAEREEAKTA